MGVSNFVFLLLAVGVFSYFFINVKKTWLKIQTTGKGQEAVRNNNPSDRVKNVLNWSLLQGKMLKDPVPGIMHLGIFWGFVIVSLGTLEHLVHGVFPAFDFRAIIGEGFLFKAYLVSQDFANFTVFVAISFAIIRRIGFAPKRLAILADDAKKDAYIVLSCILTLVTTSLVYLGASAMAVNDVDVLPSGPLVFSNVMASIAGAVFGVETPEGWSSLSDVFWWMHMLSLFGFMTFLPFSKHQHLIWVWFNMFFKSSQGSGYLRRMEFDEEAESFGVGQASEFTWKQFLDSVTCVECGRCYDQCPAASTGKKLDPRLMIHHLKDAMNDAAANPEDKRKTLIGDIVSREELWDCTTCGACMEACPLEIEHIPAIIDMRRYMTMTEGDMPAELQTTLQNLEMQSNPWGLSNDTRADWAKGLDITTMAEKSDVEYLFWVGCAGSFDDNYKKVSVSIAKIMQKSGISFSILGSEEVCNGDTARRAGNEYLADMQIQTNIETMKNYNVKKIVTGCPHCFNTISNEYPDFGFKADVIHHSELIEDLVKTGKIKPDASTNVAQSMTYHDSCYLGRHNKIYEAPRSAIKALSNDLREMERTKEKGFCCGAGGARMWMEETVGERINENRAKEALATGASTVATACPFCMTMMKDGVTAHGKENEVAVKDIAEIVAESLKD